MHDLALYLDTYPDPPSANCVERAVTLCSAVGGKATAYALHVEIRVQTNRLAEGLLQLTEMAKGEEQRSLETAQAQLAHFRELATPRQIYEAERLLRAPLYGVGDGVSDAMRYHDLCLLPCADGEQRGVAEAVIFGSGRPVMLYDPGAPAEPVAFGKIVIAWDGGRAAARAVADAMPLLRRAGEVRIVTLLNDKPDVRRGDAGKLSLHLARNNIIAWAEEIDAGGQSTTAALNAYVAEAKADLLVMGAYGHSRLREFVLGGATIGVLERLPATVLLSH